MADRLNIALAISHGTGPELVDVFEKIIMRLNLVYNPTSQNIQFRRSQRIYHSYASLLKGESSSIDIADETIEDARHYQEFCEQEARSGTRVIFRTAMSAQALYIVREKLEAVKIERFVLSDSTLLLIRDQSQGFYTGYNDYRESEGSVDRSCRFAKATFQRIISFALRRAQAEWGEVPETLTMVYKFHLFDGLLHSWAEEWSTQFGIKCLFVQPDTMNRNLLAFGIQGKCLMVASNEYADIMEPILINMFNEAGLAVQEASYAENVYLHPGLHEMSEFQTVHGSADDLAGMDIVNPTATIRAAAAILERWAICAGIQREVDARLQRLASLGELTRDQGGDLATSSFVDKFLRLFDYPMHESRLVNTKLKSPLASADGAKLLGRTALCVIDFQNDFLRGIPQLTIEQLMHNIPEVISHARQTDTEVIFVRFIGDPMYQGPSWRRRNISQSRKEHCLEGTRGAELVSPVRAQDGEQVFEKKALFDAFLHEPFDQHVRDSDIKHLILVGLFSDVCLDSTARTAFQKGLFTTIIEDASAALETDQHKAAMARMNRLYGTQVVSCVDMVGKSSRSYGKPML